MHSLARCAACPNPTPYTAWASGKKEPEPPAPWQHPELARAPWPQDLLPLSTPCSRLAPGSNDIWDHTLWRWQVLQTCVGVCVLITCPTARLLG